eukprot:2022041-Amphidinium_carterae.2
MAPEVGPGMQLLLLAAVALLLVAGNLAQVSHCSHGYACPQLYSHNGCCDLWMYFLSFLDLYLQLVWQVRPFQTCGELLQLHLASGSHCWL